MLAVPAALAGEPGAVGDLYVASRGGDKVVQFDGVTGAYVGDFVVQGSGGLDLPRGLTWGPNGNLFVTSGGGDGISENVKEYDGTTGTFVGDFVAAGTTAASGWLGYPDDAVFGPDGHLYVTGNDNGAVLKYDGTTGEWLGTFAIGGEDFGGLDAPTALAFGPNGNLFVCSRGSISDADALDRSINEYHGTTGRLVREFTGNGSVHWITGLVFRPNGNLLVTSSEVPDQPHLPNVVLEFDGATGASLGEFVPDGSGGLRCWGSRMTYGPNGNLFVTSGAVPGVIQYDGDTGALVGTFASGLSSPIGLAFKPAPPSPLPAPTIGSVSVVEHDACEPLTGVTVTGGNLDPDNTLVKLTRTDEPDYVGQVTGDSGDGAWLTVDFDLDGGARMAGGLWDVEVVNPDGQSDTLAAAIDVAPCWTASEENLFLLGKRSRATTRYGLFEFDGVMGDIIGFMVEDENGWDGDLAGATGFGFGHDGNLLIISPSPGYGSVLLYDGITGRKLGTLIPTGTGGMLIPRKLIFGPNGNLFVLHRNSGGAASGVLEFDGLTGAFVRELIPLTSTLAEPGGLAFGPNGGLLYVSNATYREPDFGAGLYVFDAYTGQYLAGPWAVPPTAVGTRTCAIEFTRDEGNLLLPLGAPPGDFRITEHDPLTGDLLGTPIPPPAGDIQQASAADFGPNGHLFVEGGDESGCPSGFVFEYDLLTGETLGVFAALTNASGCGGFNEIIFAPLLGDADGDWDVDAADAAAFDACFTGDGVPPFNNNCLTFDFDRDGDVDCDDWWAFRNDAWTANPEPVPPFTPCGDPGDPLTGDLDGDWDVDAEDFAVFVQCLDGPDNPPNGGCPPGADADLDADGDVDLADFAAFQQVFLTTGTAGDPDGACCLPDATCLEVTEPLCVLFFNGAYQGDGTDCSAPCPTGACCLPDGTCADDMTEIACAIAAGIYQGDWTDCVTNPCPLGACCSPADGTCTEVTEAECNATHGAGAYQGDGVICVIDPPTCPFGKYANTIDPVTQAFAAGTGLMLADDLELAGLGARDLVYLDLGVFGAGGGDFDVTVELWTDCPGNGGSLIPNTTFTWYGVPDNGYWYRLVVDPLSPAVTIPDTVWMVVTFGTPEAAWIIAEDAEIGFTADLFGRNDDPDWFCNYNFGGAPYAGLWANLRCVEGSSKRGSDGESRLSIEQVPTPLSIEAVGARQLGDKARQLGN